MIVGVEGRPGSGKSYLFTRWIYESLLTGRQVFTNISSFSINKAAWRIHHQIGIARERVKTHFHVLKPGDITRLHLLGLENCDIFLDEVMIAWLSRDWAKMDRGLITWFSQHRKYRVSFNYIAQSIDRVDATLRDMTQEFIVMRNTANWKFSFLRFPEMIMAIHFAEDRKTVLKRRFYTVQKFYTSMYDSWALFHEDAPQEAQAGRAVPRIGRARTAKPTGGTGPLAGLPGPEGLVAEGGTL